MTAPSESNRDNAGLQRYAADLWRLGGLWVLAVAEPILAVLRNNPEVLMGRPGSPGRGAWLLVISLCLLAPLMLGLLAFAARIAGRRAYLAIYRMLVTLLVAAIVMQFVLHFNHHLAWTAVVIAAIAGIAAGALIDRPIPRRFANIVGIALIVSPALFLASPRIAELWLGGSIAQAGVDMPERTPPVVFVLFDELQLASLLDADDRINRALYPNFAALAGDATWYRNARSVASGTITAVPAILNGMMPGESSLSPVAVNYPRNIFSMLGEKKPLHALETMTRLCPPSRCDHTNASTYEQAVGLLADTAAIFLHHQLPAAWSGWLPDIDKTWGYFWGPGTAFFPQGWLKSAYNAVRSDRGGQFHSWVDGITSDDDQAFHFIHSPLPHAPLVYYPDGRRYPHARLYMAPNQTAVEDPFQIARAYQRHVLQTVFADQLIGGLINRLKQQELYDESIIVVAADHGVHYGPGIKRRGITPQSADDVLRVPLLIKQPQQTRGRIDDRLAYTIDILPTILDALNARHEWSLDGRSLVADPAVREPLSAVDPWGEHHMRPLGAGWEGAFEPAGSIPRLGRANHLDSVYALGPHGDLVGRSVDSFPGTDKPAPEKTVWLRDAAALLEAPYTSQEVPGFVLGVYREEHRQFDAALALNGTIAAVTRSFFTDKDKDQHRFRFLLPPETFDSTINRIGIYRIEPDSGGVRLIPIYNDNQTT